MSGPLATVSALRPTMGRRRSMHSEAQPRNRPFTPKVFVLGRGQNELRSPRPTVRRDCPIIAQRLGRRRPSNAAARGPTSCRGRKEVRMNATVRRRLERATRVRDFIRAHGPTGQVRGRRSGTTVRGVWCVVAPSARPRYPELELASVATTHYALRTTHSQAALQPSRRSPAPVTRPSSRPPGACWRRRPHRRICW